MTPPGGLEGRERIPVMSAWDGRKSAGRSGVGCSNIVRSPASAKENPPGYRSGRKRPINPEM